MDYIYQLRGLISIRFYDFAKALATRSARRVVIQDKSFLEDVSSQTTMPKPPQRQENSELDKLVSLFLEGVHWTPSPDDWTLVKSVFINTNGRCSYDDLRIQKRTQDADMASYLEGSSDSGSDADESESD
jgi:hypothetical protein